MSSVSKTARSTEIKSLTPLASRSTHDRKILKAQVKQISDRVDTLTTRNKDLNRILRTDIDEQGEANMRAEIAVNTVLIDRLEQLAQEIAQQLSES